MALSVFSERGGFMEVKELGQDCWMVVVLSMLSFSAGVSLDSFVSLQVMTVEEDVSAALLAFVFSIIMVWVGASPSFSEDDGIFFFSLSFFFLLVAMATARWELDEWTQIKSENVMEVIQVVNFIGWDFM